MSSAQPIPIASSSKAPAGAGVSQLPVGSLYGSLTRSLGTSLGLSFKNGLVGSSIEMEHGSLIGRLRGQDTAFLSEDMCRDYVCCGLNLKDLHALVDHFDQAHVVVLDSDTAAQSYSAGGFDLGDDMELDEPESPLWASAATPFVQQSTLVHRGGSSGVIGFAPYSVRNPLRRLQADAMDGANCVVPELLFSPSATPSPPTSRDGSPEPADGPMSSDGDDDQLGYPQLQPIQRLFSTRAAGSIQASDLPPPRPKPFKCPKPGCNKAYKQSNGLKYHLTQGQCNFAPLDPNSEELKPYVCQASCGKRFKNMSGLRYHYLHSTHGHEGLQLLEAGRHP